MSSRGGLQLDNTDLQMNGSSHFTWLLIYNFFLSLFPYHSFRIFLQFYHYLCLVVYVILRVVIYLFAAFFVNASLFLSSFLQLCFLLPPFLSLSPFHCTKFSTMGNWNIHVRFTNTCIICVPNYHFDEEAYVWGSEDANAWGYEEACFRLWRCKCLRQWRGMFEAVKSTVVWVMCYGLVEV